ncbi:hypothetical protein [Clostridium paraputrificum]|uniref:Uncharacterized protein n=1 Tax=Clostridium paraputrificum TaxID=29363 RepID=A0A6N3GN48_9CLOT
MTKIRLKYVTENALYDLKTEFENYKEHYHDMNNEWFIEHLNKINGLLDSGIECDNFIENLNYNEDYQISDFENTKIIYSALKDLDPSTASDERLWVGLAHSQLWNFIKYRRKNEIESNDGNKIQNSFFFMRGNKRSLYVNCISRLWWTGYLTYDEGAEDPFHLTEIICKNAFASTLLLVSSNNFISNRKIAKGYLMSLKEREKTEGKISRYHFVKAAKYLNNLGSATLLDSLDYIEIKEIVDEVLNNEFGVISNS